MSKPSKNKLKKLLDRLQVESWQLELLVSGFAIFLTASSFEPIVDYGTRLFVISEGIDAQFGVLPMFAGILIGSIFFIFINLILHVVFRGMWISAIGLRSISGEIDFEELKFTRPFDKFMQKKLGSFDRFIQRLEDISSVIFAFTFLLVFMIISLFLVILFLGITAQIIESSIGENPSETVRIIVISFFVIILISALLYFIDFLTLSFFKRKRWIAVWYYPVYRFFSLITFSWLYRPLYYNLIDNKFGRRVGLFLVPYFVIVTYMITVRAHVNLYIPKDKGDLEIIDSYFENTRDEKSSIHTISIPSKFVKNGFLELFIKYNARNDDHVVERVCPSIIPDELSGIESNIAFNSGNPKEEIHSPPDSMLLCVSQIYKVYINDSLYQNLDYYFYKNRKFGEEGVKTIIDLGHSPRGKHLLKIDRMTYESSSDTSYFKSYVTTPFWLE